MSAAKLQALEGRQLPFSTEAEVSVLGGMMIEEEAADMGLELLSQKDFHHQPHRLIFEAIRRLRDSGHGSDALSVREELRKMDKYEAAGGDEYLAKIVDIVPTSANLRYHAKHVREAALKRRLIAASSSIAGKAFDWGADVRDLMDEAERDIFMVTQDRGTESDGLVQLSQLLQNTMSLIREGRQNMIPTGFRELDETIGGLTPGQLYILAARPSMGKSALGFQIAANVGIRRCKPVAIFSLEMGEELSTMRFLSTEAGVNLEYLVQSKVKLLTDDDWARLKEAKAALDDSPIFIEANGAVSVWEIRQRARRMKTQHGISLIVVDYLQLMKGRGDNRTQEVGSISRGLKRLAGELGVPIIALSQLNRSVESREDKRPQLSDLRDSGEIEQDADVVLFLYRDSYYTGPKSSNVNEAEIIVAKQRNGPCGTVYLKFDPRCTKFSDWEKMGW